MAGLPYREHYIGDWLRETRHLSLVAQAVLTNLKDLMWDRPRRGVLDNDDGSAWSDERILPLIAASEQAAARQGLNELLNDAGKLIIRNDHGALTCPSMVDAERLRRLRSSAGKRGFEVKNEGSDNLLKQVPKQTLKQKRKQTLRMKDEDDIENEIEVDDQRGRRKRDELFDAFAECFYPSGVPSGKAGMVKACAHEVRTRFAGTPDDVRKRFKAIPPEWVGTTPRGLVDHWDDLNGARPKATDSPDWIMESLGLKKSGS